jgi:hypothetical protein
MKVKMWENGLGANVVSGRLFIEVWAHGGVTRCERDRSVCGYSGTHFARVAVDAIANMAEAAVNLWRNDPKAWTPCEA